MFNNPKTLKYLYTYHSLDLTLNMQPLYYGNLIIHWSFQPEREGVQNNLRNLRFK